MKLIIVESPHKADTIKKFLGSGYEVQASAGHIKDLATSGKNGLGVDVEHGFKADWRIDKKKYAIVNKLKDLAKKSDEVILATDPDREGEAIAYHLADVLKLDVATAKRLEFHEVTKPAVVDALENPRTIDTNLVDSQETRRIFDRIIGFKLSDLLKKKINAISAGRVQSATLKMIVDNDAERKAFVPEEYWTIQVDIKVGDKVVTAKLNKVDGKTPKITSKEEADAILDRISATLNASSIKKTPKKILPKPPFTTSTLQQEAYNRFRFSTSMTQSIAQTLYEGLDIGGERVGLITYMRTDSARISPLYFQRHGKRYIEETYGEKYLGHVQSAKNQALAQDAHEAIRPTAGLSRTPEKIAPYLNDVQKKLYRLIFCRAMASLMAPKEIETTGVIFAANGLEFSLSGTRVLFPGYSAVYGQFDDDDEASLPEIEQGKDYEVVKKDSEQKFTQPPAAYTEAKIVKLMEEKGIGRPSTYASTLARLQEVNYVVSDGGVFTPTEIGITVTNSLSKYFPEIVDSQYTASMEKELDSISQGSEDKLTALENFYGPFIEKFNEVSKVMEKTPDVQTGEFCPDCGAPLVIKKSKYGEFTACSNYPKCKFKVVPEKPKAKETGEFCPKCGAPLVERKGRKGKIFVGCSAFPKCDYIKADENAKPLVSKKKATKTTYTEKDYVKDCPDCNGHLVIKVSKKGKKFLACTNFPKCKHAENLPEEK